MQGLDEHMSNGESPDQQSTDAGRSNYTSLDHRTMQDNHVYDVISTPLPEHCMRQSNLVFFD